MGSLKAAEFAAGVQEGLVDLAEAVTYHLQYNHYPPVPACMVTPCMEAIQKAQDEDWDALIALPAGVTWQGQSAAPAWAVVQGHHLEAFIQQDEGV